ncbi:hypothetical protein E3N88_17017 [Mikania micrantha]|uniref:Ty3 transposon capsid-like protein domain-containing protein n=1 Tax=Mikania micrantha TaxID=192012 RepID=A0A5N6NQR7_9ASTR|nr:hypothetical protein E3N88_17017 [Mikania micrantha]
METRTTNVRLDAHENQIQQLQADVTDIKATLHSLEEERAESAEFRKVVLAWMKNQEKKSVDGSFGSGSSSNLFSNSGPTVDPPPGIPWAVKKIKLPEFNGFDPQGWIQKATLYFDINHTPEELRIRLAQLSMVGVAQHWFTVISQLKESISWTDFQLELLQRFSGLEIHNPYEQLATIQQGDSIHDYLDDFEYLLSLVPRLSESQAIGYFIAGLKEDVKKWVRLHRPTSRLDAMHLAKDVENMLRPSSLSGNMSQSRFRYLNRSGPFIADGLPPLGQPEPKHTQSNRLTDKPFSSHSDVFRSVPPSKSMSQSSSSTSVFQRDRGVRSLSRSEWEDRRKKGLCFRCGHQFGPAHKCPEGKLRVLLLGDDEYEAEEGEQLLLEMKDPPDPGKDPATGTCLALEFAGLVDATGGVPTLRFDGALHGISINMLVDSGATHNFVSRRLVVALGIPSINFSGICIKLGDGHSVLVTERCFRLPINLGSCTFLVDALVFDTGSLDLILGMSWLQSLGEVVHDWQHSWMKFSYKGKSVLLQGILHNQSTKAALNQWLSLDDILSPTLTALLPPSGSTYPLLTSDQQSDLSSLTPQSKKICYNGSMLWKKRSKYGIMARNITWVQSMSLEGSGACSDQDQNRSGGKLATIAADKWC